MRQIQHPDIRAANGSNSASIQKLEAFMVPQTFEIVEQLPRTANGKVDKRSLSAEQGQMTFTREGSREGMTR